MVDAGCPCCGCPCGTCGGSGSKYQHTFMWFRYPVEAAPKTRS